jgi:1,4-alpha-glucan branching enzyme
MNKQPVISIVLNAHQPFVRHPEIPNAAEERWFFEALSETYIPLLEVFDRLDAEHIPFKAALCVSPSLCNMLKDEYLIEKYLKHTNCQIEFGLRELERTAEDEDVHKLARLFYDAAVEKRLLFTERYESNILKVLDVYQRKGRVELLTTAATHSFLPLYAAYPEAVQAQLEVAVASYRRAFGKSPQGFWLPELGWTAELDGCLRAYNFSYTITDTHSLLLRNNPARRGSFYPVKTAGGLFVLARDFYACRELEACELSPARDPVYRDYNRDIGFELPLGQVKSFLGQAGKRTMTGYKYWRDEGREIYNPEKAAEKADECARLFLDALIKRLHSASEYMEETPVSVCACDADSFGRFWHEGMRFLESLFREGARRAAEIQFVNPAEYLYKQNVMTFETAEPGFSSWGANGYAEMWLDASNDWLYRHAIRSLKRMTELAERFPDDTGLKERALNQAAREILLVQSSDWAKMLYNQDNAEYAKNQIVNSLRNFTTIYESLGSNYISTEWLTSLEKRHTIFPNINYRVFRRKK